MDFSDTHHLGVRAFILFLGRHIKWPFIFLLFLIVLSIEIGRITNLLPPYYSPFAPFIFESLWLLWGALMVFVLFRSYFEYRGYSYRFDDEYFNVTEGYVTRNETGVVYHQIQHVTIKRGILDRLVGTSHLIIVMNMTGNNPSASHIVLPALNKNKAKLIHRELLRKAHHQSTNMNNVRDEVRYSEVDKEDDSVDDE